MRAQHPTALAAGLLTITALSLAGCSAPAPASTDASQTSQGAPAHSSAPAGTPPSGSPTDSGIPSVSASTDASTVPWAGGVQVVPSSGPVKLPAPKTQDAAMEVVFQMVQRNNIDIVRLYHAQSTDVSGVKPYVKGTMLDQIESDAKAYKRIKFSGTPRIERILEPKNSWATTGEVTTKEGEKVRTKYGSVRLQVCADNSDVKLTDAPKGTVVDKVKRRVFTADAFYYPTEQRWFLTSYKEADGNPTC